MNDCDCGLCSSFTFSLLIFLLILSIFVRPFLPRLTILFSSSFSLELAASLAFSSSGVTAFLYVMTNDLIRCGSKARAVLLMSCGCWIKVVLLIRSSPIPIHLSLWSMSFWRSACDAKLVTALSSKLIVIFYLAPGFAYYQKSLANFIKLTYLTCAPFSALTSNLSAKFSILTKILLRSTGCTLYVSSSYWLAFLIVYSCMSDLCCYSLDAFDRFFMLTSSSEYMTSRGWSIRICYAL